MITLYHVCAFLAVVVGLFVADKIVNALQRFDSQVAARRKAAGKMATKLAPLVAVSASPFLAKMLALLTDYSTCTIGGYKVLVAEVDHVIKDVTTDPDAIITQFVDACREVAAYADKQSAAPGTQATKAAGL